MPSQVRNLFSGTLTSQELTKCLPKIFNSSVVVDAQQTIVAVHESVLKCLNYTSLELIGRNIIDIANDTFESRLKSLLLKSAFQNTPISFLNNSGKPVMFKVSGFHLGLVSDIDDLHVLQLTEISDVQDSSTPMDDFIYRAAHDLRGPLATIKGLVNLLNGRHLPDEFKEIVRLLHFQTEKMDQRLFELRYIAGIPREGSKASYEINFTKVETVLRDVIVKNSFLDDSIYFKFNAPQTFNGRCNEHLITSVSVHILEFILNFPVAALPAEIKFTFEERPLSLWIHVTFSGFNIDKESRDAMAGYKFLYSDLMSYPRLVNYFAARKIATELNGTLEVSFGTNSSIILEIPLDVL